MAELSKVCWSPTAGCTAPSTYRASTRGPALPETRYGEDIFIFGLAGPSVQLAMVLCVFRISLVSLLKVLTKTTFASVPDP